jgi:hypothetical protein
MARKPTPFSVTSTPCRCPWLQNAASEPQVPVRFEEKFGEYQVERRDGGYLVIRHCPWCGGAAPSKRASLFATIPNTELRRLGRLTANLKTVEDALAHLGKPDDRHPEGLTIHTPARGRRPAQAETFPTMTFSKLSKVADVTLADYGPRGVGFSFSPKYLGKPRVKPRRRRSARPSRV